MDKYPGKIMGNELDEKIFCNGRNILRHVYPIEARDVTRMGNFQLLLLAFWAVWTSLNPSLYYRNQPLFICLKMAKYRISASTNISEQYRKYQKVFIICWNSGSLKLFYSCHLEKFPRLLMLKDTCKGGGLSPEHCTVLNQ